MYIYERADGAYRERNSALPAVRATTPAPMAHMNVATARSSRGRSSGATAGNSDLSIGARGAVVAEWGEL
jgi:hypothetical protein